MFGNARFVQLIAGNYLASRKSAAAVRASYRLAAPDEALFAPKSGVAFKRRALLEPWHFLADILSSESKKK